MPGELIRLNIGGATNPIDGYTVVDRKTGQEAYPLAYPDASVDEIRASHVLEHFGHQHVHAVLADWTRALKLGGILKIAVPDFEKVARAYVANCAGLPLQQWVMGGHIDDNDKHGCIFDHDMLHDAMRSAGLIDIEPWAGDKEDCSGTQISLNLMGRKPIMPQFRVGCAMSVPRLGFTANFFAWAKALLPMRIMPHSFEGAFWGQCLERTMASLVDNHDVILTVDYDTFFTGADVAQMLLILANHPEVDAVAPVQARRGPEGTPLFWIKGKQALSREELSRPLLKVDTAHFGCTLIRCEPLRKLPHPWFLGQPNAEGKWEEGRIDDDIYFWQKWTGAGNSVYIAPRVQVGHGEYVNMILDDRAQLAYQSTADYRKHGLPANAWR
jgi:predicted SAM-dependent methyltransferase